MPSVTDEPRRTVTVRLDNSKDHYVPSHPPTPIMGNDEPMTTYDGPATVIADGTEYEVTASLTLTDDGRLKEWHGSLDTPSEEAAWNIFEADNTKLRIGQGRQGSFFAVRSEAGATDMDIQGSGPAPFGE